MVILGGWAFLMSEVSLHTILVHALSIAGDPDRNLTRVSGHKDRRPLKPFHHFSSISHFGTSKPPIVGWVTACIHGSQD